MVAKACGVEPSGRMHLGWGLGLTIILALFGLPVAAQSPMRSAAALVLHDAVRVNSSGSTIATDRTGFFRERVPADCRQRVRIFHAADSARPVAQPSHAWAVPTEVSGQRVTVFVQVFADALAVPRELAARASLLSTWLSFPLDDDRARHRDEISWIVCALALRDALATSDWHGAVRVLDALNATSGRVGDRDGALRADLLDLTTTPLCGVTECNDVLAEAVIAALESLGMPVPRNVQPRALGVTSWHMRWLTTLTFDDGRAKARSPSGLDLSGLESATNLVSLNARGQGIADLTPIGHLASLEELDVRDNAIESLAPLRNATALRVLTVDGNPLIGGAQADGCAPDPLRPLHALALERLSLRRIPGGLPCPLQGALAAHVEVLDISHNGDAFAAAAGPFELPALVRLTADGAPTVTVNRIHAPVLRDLEFGRRPESLEPQMDWYLAGEVPDLRRFPMLTSLDLTHRHIAWVDRPFDAVPNLRSLRLHGATSHVTLDDLHVVGVDPETLLPAGLEILDLSVRASSRPCREVTTPIHGGALPLRMVPASVRALDVSGRCLVGVEHASLDLDLLCVIGSEFGPAPRTSARASALRVRHLVFGSGAEFGTTWGGWFRGQLERPGATFRASFGETCPLPAAPSTW